MLGTILNTAAIVIGGALGLLISNRLPERARETILHGLGLVTLVIGFQMALRTHNVLIVLFSILLGGLLGEWWRLDDRLNALGGRIERVLSRGQPAVAVEESSGRAVRSISRAFVAASLVFCVGPIAILGPLQESLLADPSLLLVKSVLDFFASIALAASLGPGVIVAAGSVLVYQGSLGVAANLLRSGLGLPPASDAPAIVELSATGGVIIVALGLVLLNLKPIRVANFLPAIVLAPLFVVLLAKLALFP